MQNMAMTKEELAEYKGDCCPTPGGSEDAPKYPWGLEISLDDGSLTKLGLTELPPVGTKLLVQAQVMVTRVSSSQMADGDAESSMGLQITDMELSKPARTDEQRAAALYSTAA